MGATVRRRGKNLVLEPSRNDFIGLSEGDVVVAQLRKGSPLERIQKRFATVAPGISLADELIAQRRAEAARERLD